MRTALLAFDPIRSQLRGTIAHCVCCVVCVPQAKHQASNKELRKRKYIAEQRKQGAGGEEGPKRKKAKHKH